MDLLFVTPGFGADPDTSFMPLVATELVSRGHDVQGVQYEEGETPDTFPVDTLSVPNITTPWWAGRWLIYQTWKQSIQSYIAEKDPDVIVADRVCIAPTVKAAQSIDVPVISVIPGLGFTRFDPLDLGVDKTPSLGELPWSAKIQYPFVRSLFHQNKKALSEADEVVVISEFLQQTIETTFSRRPTIVRTPVPVSSIQADSHNRAFITLVNPRNELKGADVFERIANAMPDENFQVAGTFASSDREERIRSLDNVELLGWVDDMREVYARTKLVLVPSRYEEGGGPRVVLEGFANGVPAIGTDRGAIPEHIQGAGKVVSDPDCIDEWQQKIQGVLSNREYFSAKAEKQVKSFDAERQVNQFEEVIKSLV